MYIDSQGNKWFKGNLHTHTTESDGKLSPEAAAELYKSHGYDFLARTDHWKVSPADEFDGILCLSGCEYNVGRTPKEGIYHVVGVGMANDPMIKQDFTPQQIVSKIHEIGGIAILAHPAWSLNSPAQIMAVHGETPFDMTEIFNSTSDLPKNCRPYSGLITDMLAAEGVFLPLGAADDVHWYTKQDSCRSFIYVQSSECTREAILKSIKLGNFYASQGPRLQVQLVDGKVIVNCDPVTEIVYYTDSVWTGHRSDVGENLTHGEYALTPLDTFVRVEVQDADGNWAWSPYIVVG